MVITVIIPNNSQYYQVIHPRHFLMLSSNANQMGSNFMNMGVKK